MIAKRFLLPVLLLWIALPAVAQKIYIDYDHATAFSQFKTFQIHETPQDLRRRALRAHQMIVRELRNLAAESALTEVDSNPDMVVAYYAADRGTLNLALSDLEYSYGADFTAGDYWDGGVGTRTPDTFSFREGTLVIDIWDPARKVLVWRTIATAVVKNDPAKNEKKISKALKKISKQWGEMYGDNVRALRKYQAENDDTGGS